VGVRPGVLIDIDGVLTTSWQAIPGAPEALAALRQRGVPFVLVTNTTSRRRGQIADLLRHAGFVVDAAEILTTAAITAGYLARHHPGRSIELLNSGDVAEDLDGVPIVDRDGDVMVLGGAGPEFTYEAVNRVFRRVQAGAPLVAMNPNLMWRTSDGYQLDAGAYLLALEAAAGASATVTGKPSPAFFLTALEQIGGDAAHAFMVGDDLRTDVLGAQASGLHGVLVRTGKFRSDQLAGTTDQPEFVVDSFADLPDLLDAQRPA
jgi:HAD superfamily hydrolase (TIGR01458 family)